LGDAEAKVVPSKWEKAKSEKWKWGVEGRVKKMGQIERLKGKSVGS
jgi:hypothetical protein